MARYVVTIQVELDVEQYADDEAMAIAMAVEELESELDPSNFYTLGEPKATATIDPDPPVLSGRGYE